MRRNGSLFDFGRTVLGRVSFHGAETPRLYVGESAAEARCDDLSVFEQNTSLRRQSNGTWESANLLAFRFVRVDGAQPDGLLAKVVCRPEQYRGAFSCDDKLTNKIWYHSTYTLRACMNHLMLDGLKRDRLPWIGDQTTSLMANAYTFADAEVARRTFTALGRNGIESGDINGIVDYSLWWMIVHDWHQLYFDDIEYRRREWPRIWAAVEHLQTLCNSHDYLQPRAGAWLFIDWGVESQDRLTSVPLQIIWYWALNSAASLAERIDEQQIAVNWRNRARDLAKALHAEAWNVKKHGYLLHLEAPDDLSRHTNLLTVLSELANSDQRPYIREHLSNDALPRVITPYMASLELIALSRLNAEEEILPRIHEYWECSLTMGRLHFGRSMTQMNQSKSTKCMIVLTETVSAMRGVREQPL